MQHKAMKEGLSNILTRSKNTDYYGFDDTPVRIIQEDVAIGSLETFMSQHMIAFAKFRYAYPRKLYKEIESLPRTQWKEEYIKIKSMTEEDLLIAYFDATK